VKKAMEFNKQIYPEEMQDNLEKAVENSAENYIENKLKEESPSCEECGSESLEAKVENSKKDFSEKAICVDCGNIMKFDLEPGDLKDY